MRGNMSKKGVGKAADLMAFIFLSVLGYFIVQMVFIDVADQGQAELECSTYTWRNSDNLLTTLYTPITLEDGVDVPLYMLLVSEGDEYDAFIDEALNSVYGERSWFLRVRGEDFRTIRLMHEIQESVHIQDFACFADFSTREEKFSLYQDGEEILIEIHYEVRRSR